MIIVRCHTNLDLVGEKWPHEMPAIPAIGHNIKSRTIWLDGFQLVLEVVDVTWEYNILHEGYIANIELHIPKNKQMNITQFYNWYAPKVGKSPSAFI